MKETGAEGRLRKAGGVAVQPGPLFPQGGKQEWTSFRTGASSIRSGDLATSTNPRAQRWWGSVPDTPPVCPQAFCCPYCSFLSPESEQVRAHALSQHAVQPTLRAPLCQEQLVGRPALHFHLRHLHNVVPECVERLLSW